MAVGMDLVEVGDRAAALVSPGVDAADELLEGARPRELVLAPRVCQTPVIEADADPVDGVIARVIGRVRVVFRIERAVPVRIEDRRILRTGGGRVLPAHEWIPAALVRGPDHRRARRTLMYSGGDPLEGAGVLGRLLRPRVPGTVHLVREPHQHRDAVLRPR